MKKPFRFLLISILTVFVSLSVCVSVYAAEGLPFLKNGSITVELLTPGQKEPIGNVSVRLFRVAEVDDSSYTLQYTLTEDYTAAGVFLSGLSASQAKALAKDLAIYTNIHTIPGVTGSTGSNGKACFDNLQPGVYLLIFGAFDNHSVYNTPDPVLVSVPVSDTESSEWIYDVTVYPKTELKPKPTTQPQETTTKIGDLPDTGVLRWPVPVLSAGGILLFSLGWSDSYLKRKKNGRNKK